MSTISAKLGAVDENGKPRSYCMGVQQRSSFEETRLLVRGEIDQPAQVVDQGFPQVISTIPVSINSGASGRLELAQWIASDENPLTARVMVNRIWQQMIGQGIVTTTENFGTSGQPPSHPELLDYLAVRFIESGWSVKSLVRDIATSRVYRIASTFNEDFHERDPDNALIWRANPRRLSAESIRDAMLSISGEIDYDRPRGSEVAKAGYKRIRNGTLFDPRELLGNRGMQSARDTQGQRFAGVDRRKLREAALKAANALNMEDAKFRSVYLPILRDEVPRSLEVFDFADPSAIIGKREASNTANQALYMMNNRFVIQQSQALAQRVANEYSQPYEQVKQLFLLTYGRLPTAGERSATSSFIRKFGKSTTGKRGPKTLSALCQSLFASAEFRFVD